MPTDHRQWKCLVMQIHLAEEVALTFVAGVMPKYITSYKKILSTKLIYGNFFSASVYKTCSQSEKQLIYGYNN